MVNKKENIGFIIHGQSNASGNVLSSEIDSSLKHKQLNCNILNLDGKKVETLKVGINTYGVPIEYLDLYKLHYSTGVRYGVEVELSKLLRDYYHSEINVFKYTWPGSGLSDWTFGTGTMMPKVATEYANYKNAVKTNTDEQFLVWIQGEGNIGGHVAYKTNIKTWIDTYRSVLGFNIPLIIVSLSNKQTYLNATYLGNFKIMQNTLGSVIYNNSSETFTTQVGFIDNCYVLDQNEPCQNESGIYIHYSNVGISNIAKGVFEIVKKYIIN